MAARTVPTRSGAAGWRCALTFDDGPSEWTPWILEALAEYDAKATFFVIAANARRLPDTLREIVAAGHQIGNHTYTHPRLSTLTREQQLAEILDARQLIADIADVTPAVWRAPHFDLPDGLDQAVLDLLGIRHVDRTIDPSDWNTFNPVDIAGDVLADLAAGAIVDLHDGIPPGGGQGLPSRAHVIEAVKLILAKADSSIAWTTVDELAIAEPEA